MNLYAILIGLGASFGMWRVTQNSLPQDAWRNAVSALAVLAGALLGARIAFFFWQPGYITALGWGALHFEEGGLIWPGAIAGSWLAIGILAILRKQDLRKQADYLTPLLPPLAMMTWLAAITTGGGYGAEISPDFRLPSLLNERGVWVSQIPNQWLAALSLFILFLFLEPRLHNRPAGVRSALTWLVFSVHTAIFSYLRADPRPLWQGLPFDVIAAAALLALAVIYTLTVFLLHKYKM